MKIEGALKGALCFLKVVIYEVRWLELSLYFRTVIVTGNGRSVMLNIPGPLITK
jgi:hypothetical protein